MRKEIKRWLIIEKDLSEGEAKNEPKKKRNQKKHNDSTLCFKILTTKLS